MATPRYCRGACSIKVDEIIVIEQSLLSSLLITNIYLTATPFLNMRFYPRPTGHVLTSFSILERGTKSIIKIGDKIIWVFKTN
jgi:hypothetical protein